MERVPAKVFVGFFPGICVFAFKPKSGTGGVLFALSFWGGSPFCEPFRDPYCDPFGDPFWDPLGDSFGDPFGVAFIF